MENYEKHYREIEKLTDNPFLNLYHIDALGRDGTPFHYYFASRNDKDNIKHKTHSMSPRGHGRLCGNGGWTTSGTGAAVPLPHGRLPL